MKLSYTANIKDGKVNIVNRKYFDKEVEKFEGKTVTISIEKKKIRRSDPQNRYYWGVVIPIVCEGIKDTGEEVTNEQTHELLKFKYLRMESTNLIYAKSTAGLTTVEFLEYIDQIVRFATEFLNVYIPDPDESLGIEIKWDSNNVNIIIQVKNRPTYRQ